MLGVVWGRGLGKRRYLERIGVFVFKSEVEDFWVVVIIFICRFFVLFSWRLLLGCVVRVRRGRC